MFLVSLACGFQIFEVKLEEIKASLLPYKEAGRVGGVVLSAWLGDGQ